jgi:hypothetical protein
MPKKRRVTTEQAKFLALVLIQRVVVMELLSGATMRPDDMRTAYFRDHLPEKWYDGQTSDQSWEHVWDEMRIQLGLLLDCFAEEATRLSKENQGFRV